MVKAHSPINWQNSPSVSTPLNGSNLNKMDNTIGVLDDRIIVLDTTKASQTDMLTAFSGIAFDKETGILILYRKNGAQEVIDTGLSKVTVNLDFDDDTQQFILYLVDGTEKRIDVSALISQNEFVDSDTVYWTVSSDGKVQASIAKGSITADMLEPNYLANVQLYASQALSSARNAKESEENASASEEKARGYAEEARQYAQQTEDLIEQIDTRLELATFSINDNGELVYTDNFSYEFTVDNETGMLNYQVVQS